MPITAYNHDAYFSSVFVWPKAGRRLQPIKAPELLDHSPIGVFVRTKTSVMHKPKNQQIDRNALMRCVLRGEKRHELFDNIKKRSQEVADLREKAREHRSAAIMYHIIVQSIRKAAIDTFPKEKRVSNGQQKQFIKERDKLFKKKQRS